MWKEAMYLLGPESAAVPWIALVGVCTVLLLIVVVIAARRRGDYASAAIPLIAAAYGGIALASGVAVWMFSRTLDEMYRLGGGGIASLSFGMWQAARVPLAAAWVALAATALALLFVVLSSRTHPQPARASSLWLGVLALASGIVAVLLFRGVLSFTLDIAFGVRPVDVDGLTIRLLAAGAGAVLCFVAAIALMAAGLRRGAVPLRMAVLAVVVSVVASATLISDLGAYSNHWRDVALKGAPVQAASAARE